MKNTIRSIKNRLQIPADAKQIQNYCYFPNRILGTGNYSTVYEAFSLSNSKNQSYEGEKIAAKVIGLKLYGDQKMVELLEQEIQILLTLDHPNIIKCFDVLKTSEECYCFTELCEGGPLAQLIFEKGRLTEEEAWPFIRDIYEGLNYLNSKGIIHRDIKAANIFLKDGVAKIADFGFAKHSKVTFTDLNIGSPIYMAPEGYISNTYGPKTEVWAFGIVIYQMLHGTTPFTHILDPEILIKALTVQLQTTDFRPDLSPELKDLMRSCLQIDEKKRISMAQIQFTRYMQKRHYGRYCLNSQVIADKKPISSGSFITRYNSSSNTIKIPCRVNIKQNSNNQNQYLEVPEVDRMKEKEEKTLSETKVIRLKSTLKIDNQPLSAVTKNPVTLTTTPRIKASDLKIRIIEPQRNKYTYIRRTPQLLIRTPYVQGSYEPMSAQLK